MRLAFAPWGETVQEQVEAAAAGERAGFESLWTSELHRTAYVPAAAIAAATGRAQVGTAVALAFVRSPMVTALTALDLDELSGGRFVLGLGPGVRRLNEDWHGAEYGRPAPHLRETVAAVRLLVERAGRGEPIELEGEFERLRVRGWQRPFPAPRSAIPVYLAAVGPQMLRLAGEIGDGWISHELCSPGYLRERALPLLEQGLRRAGRSREALTVMASGVCCLGADRHGACRRAAGLVAFYATVRSYEEFFDFHGFLPQARAIRERFLAGDEAGMVDACPDEMVSALALAGTADDVRGRLREYEGLADVVKLSPPTHLVPVEVTRDAQAAILELFEGGG
jgi:probable F420-dependent oxidoreductase